MNQETRLERIVGREDLPGFFREMAEMLESGQEGELPLSEFRKMKISLEDKQGAVQVSIKYKLSKATATRAGKPVTERPLSYKELKRRMQLTYKTIFSMIHQDRVPPNDVVERFLADSRLMISFPGYGEPYYREYEEACLAFARAFEKGDMALLHQTFDRLDQVRSHCHNRYK
jgi:XXXCH domain-containing protein